MNISYEKLPLVDLTAPKALTRHGRKMNRASKAVITQNFEDAETILKLAGLNINLDSENIIEAGEKYMIETQTNNTTVRPSEKTTIGIMQKANRRPHYTRLLVFDNSLIFQAACCLPLKIVAASLDGNNVSGRVLFNSHSESGGGKLVYEFMEKGTRMVVDLRRGESTRAQRLIFKGIGNR
ncbi:MAG: hypothetical protein ACE5KZ_12425 [Candidatus Scalinduaceae bacterium]